MLLATICLQWMDGGVAITFDEILSALCLVVYYVLFGQLAHVSADGTSLYFGRDHADICVPRESIVAAQPWQPWYFLRMQVATIEYWNESGTLQKVRFAPQLKQEGGSGTKATTDALDAWLRWPADKDPGPSVALFQYLRR